MHVCMLTTSFPRYPGDAAGQFVSRLADELSKKYEVTVIAPGSQELPDFEVVRNVRVCRFSYFFPHRFEKLAYGDGIIENVRANFFCRFLIPSFSLSFLLKSIILARRCDLIHAHWAFSGLIALLGKRIHRKPIVLTLRGSDVNFNFAGTGNSKTFLRWVLQGCDHVATVSRDLSEKIVRDFAIAQKVTVVPNGVDLECFRPRDKSGTRRILGLSDQVPVILYAGRITESKGVGYLAAAMPAVVKECEDVVFVLLGEGNLRLKISKFGEEMGIRQHILFAGYRPHDELPMWLNAADLLVLPSLSEGRPNIILEAMACGIPIVATRVGGIPELIRDGENGILVPPNDVEALTKAILAVLKMDDRRETFGKRARETLESLKVDWESSAEKMAGVYEKVLARR